MVVGKNPRAKKAKKGKKYQNPFEKKDWYNVIAPDYFPKRFCGKTVVTRSQGTRKAFTHLKGRVLTVSMADLTGSHDEGFRNVRFKIEEVRGEEGANAECLTQFHGMHMTRDKLCSLIRKWQSLIEASVDVKTTDGYSLRVFVIGFTKRANNQKRKFAYAKGSVIAKIRAKMTSVVKAESQCTLTEFVKKLIPRTIGSQIEKSCSGLYLMQDVYVRKVKVTKAPRFDLGKLLDIHSETKLVLSTTTEDIGSKAADLGTGAKVAPIGA